MEPPSNFSASAPVLNDDRMASCFDELGCSIVMESGATIYSLHHYIGSDHVVLFPSQGYCFFMTDATDRGEESNTCIWHEDAVRFSLKF